MAKQTFTTGQVLTAEQMTSLQQTAMGGGSATAKTASYVLVAADAGATVIMNAAGATTITVNTSLFSAGDTVFLQNIGAGICTITAGTATVNTASSLALAQYGSGYLYFTAAGASIFSKSDGAAAGGGGKVLQVVAATTTTETATGSSTYIDSTLTATITPTLATSKVLVLVSQAGIERRGDTSDGAKIRLRRGASDTIAEMPSNLNYVSSTNTALITASYSISILDAPATTSATTYKTQFASASNDGRISVQYNAATSSIVLLEIGA